MRFIQSRPLTDIILLFHQTIYLCESAAAAVVAKHQNYTFMELILRAKLNSYYFNIIRNQVLSSRVYPGGRLWGFKAPKAYKKNYFKHKKVK